MNETQIAGVRQAASGVLPGVPGVGSKPTVADPGSSSKRVLEPIERISEVLFGLIMVLTFTCSLSVAEAGRMEVRAMLLGALGCNIAWGVIDAIMYLMGCLAERARSLATLRAVRAACSGETSSYSSGTRKRSASHSIAPTKSSPCVSRTKVITSPFWWQPKQ